MRKRQSLVGKRAPKYFSSVRAWTFLISAYQAGGGGGGEGLFISWISVLNRVLTGRLITNSSKLTHKQSIVNKMSGRHLGADG